MKRIELPYAYLCGPCDAIYDQPCPQHHTFLSLQRTIDF